MAQGFTPKSAVAAQSINWLFNNVSAAETSAKAAIGGLTDFVGQMQTENAAFSPLSYVKAVVFDPKFQVIWAGNSVTSTPKLSYLRRPGATPVDVISAVAVAGDNQSVGSIDVDPSGNVVAVYGARFGYMFSPIANAAYRVDIGGTGMAAVLSCVYEPVSGRWLAAGYAGGTAPQIRFAPGGSTAAWSVGGNIAGAIGVGNDLRLVTNKTGLVLAVRSGPGANVGVWKSTDGGTNWSGSLTAITSTTLTSGSRAEVSYSTDTNLFYVSLSSTSTLGSEVWTSPDGVTWTRITRLANSYLAKVITMGSMLVSAASFGTDFLGQSTSYSAYSLDGGATWKSSGLVLSTGAYATVGRGDGFCIFACLDSAVADIGGVYWGERMGIPSTAVLT